ncbi:hypothetical protein L1987_57712 [Smallanthus sonchifolius]|uniref:Uncharacterized protein n=1 Tax=Smallanthus sonchifolius TaxID=185202 RepID=A0ACB9DDW4_9ASTR|nr:hypothetical protein L1987_57712 [Smallanthus sonchifolius]
MIRFCCLRSTDCFGQEDILSGQHNQFTSMNHFIEQKWEGTPLTKKVLCNVASTIKENKIYNRYSLKAFTK